MLFHLPFISLEQQEGGEGSGADNTGPLSAHHHPSTSCAGTSWDRQAGGSTAMAHFLWLWAAGSLVSPMPAETAPRLPKLVIVASLWIREWLRTSFQRTAPISFTHSYMKFNFLSGRYQSVEGHVTLTSWRARGRPMKFMADRFCGAATRAMTSAPFVPQYIGSSHTEG